MLAGKFESLFYFCNKKTSKSTYSPILLEIMSKISKIEKKCPEAFPGMDNLIKAKMSKVG